MKTHSGSASRLLAMTALVAWGATAGPVHAQDRSGPNAYNACRLLTSPEIDALTGTDVLMASVEEAAPERSICLWEDSKGLVFKLTVYWTGGRQHWETWRTAQGLGAAVLRDAEGVAPDSVVRQGLVPGLGDAAYFSELLPSLLLKGDVLAEMEMSLVPHPERKFRQLAVALLSRM